ncbi:CDP-glycerol glycerophosphotransferase family protein [Listeria monocytogenes]|uniref:CDP-glycerol glycerophosphotransferase family protein n=1 Tax=Listeria monocytogenes TaxID=1639 RepID=UPI0010B9FC9E|nr:CDP-glycerol glycerophosphotransferase family protein [Listeria monocytogenes]EAF4522967.1 CDP-glycerol glycerophosphotransferase family protein [Listeria monocytogenes serotype 1/2a]EAC5126455.1 CDP-glycerol glycerophosphotransferase family protein [Listeria monocytogenes]EAD2050985.1 CDP-glycerol glycerophosphotransferase family protein [Listeria monocytogenes]EAD2937161.1 CDP-glycerol glycerophosphotransferase family protein [Listeria monocytogenes]EAD2960339.1 CDP-glycerol glycerophosph
MIVKNIAISMYMFLLSLFSFFSRFFGVKKRVLIMASFPENTTAILNQMKKMGYTPNTICFHTERVQFNTKELDFVRFLPNNLGNKWKLMFYLNTSKVILVDNYYPELAAVSFKDGVECIQLWHANGALKQFGWEDNSISERSDADKKRFKAVYEHFLKVVVGSDEMGEIFKRSFLLNESHLLKIGVPRTDVYFEESLQQQKRIEWRNKFHAENKKVILYAPTFRDNELAEAKLVMDFNAMERAFSEDYLLVLKLHPAVKIDVQSLNTDFIINVDKNVALEELLAAVDILITDYSSIPFEFALFERPIYFFSYDMEKYDKERGLIKNYQEIIPGPISQTTAELIEQIKTKTTSETLALFSKKWNKYSDGHASERMVVYMKQLMEEAK